MTDPATDRSVVSFIGLGNMGQPMAQRLVEAGYQVRGYDRSADALTELERHGGVAGRDALDVAKGAHTIVLMLPDSDVVDAVLDSLLRGGVLREGATVIDMSSSEPDRTRHNAARTADAGARLVDAPVSGGVRGAVAGTLTIMVGTDQPLTDDVTHLLEHLGRVVVVGGAGSGHAAKALNNLLSASHLWLTSEAVLVGQRFGIDPEAFLGVVNGASGRSGSSEVKWPRFILPGTFDSGFAARLMLKDTKIATALADQLGLPTRLGDATVQAWTDACAELPADADHTEIARYLQEQALRSDRSDHEESHT
jgi:3-hydroxyisobutyrate dehydrogenase